MSAQANIMKIVDESRTFEEMAERVINEVGSDAAYIAHLIKVVVEKQKILLLEKIQEDNQTKINNAVSNLEWFSK